MPARAARGVRVAPSPPENANNGKVGGRRGPCKMPGYHLSHSVANDFDFDQFQAIVDLLFAEGLTTEHVEKTAHFGPPIAAKDLQPTNGTVAAGRRRS